MDINGRPNHIEDYLVSLHTGQWFGWSDSKNKIYSNLIIHDDSKSKPSENDCINGLTNLQADYDAKQYQRDRVYPSIQEQLDMQYWDKVNGTTTWKDAVAKVKSDNPKN
jgi:hypothetical protein